MSKPVFERFRAFKSDVEKDVMTDYGNLRITFARNKQTGTVLQVTFYIATTRPESMPWATYAKSTRFREYKITHMALRALELLGAGEVNLLRKY